MIPKEVILIFKQILTSLNLKFCAKFVRATTYKSLYLNKKQMNVLRAADRLIADFNSLVFHILFLNRLMFCCRV